MSAFSTFLSKNKVFILGAAGAVGIALQQFVGSATVDYKALGFAALIAVVSYFAKNLKGAVSSIAALLGNALVVIGTTAAGTKISYLQIGLQILIGIIGVLSTGQSAVVSTTTSTSSSVDSVKAVGQDVVKTS